MDVSIGTTSDDALESATPSAVATGRGRHGVTLEATSFDLRTRRDIFGRRLWRGSVHRTARVSALLAGDAIATYVAVFVSSLWTVAPTRWTEFLPIAFALVVAGQATASTYGPIRAPLRGNRMLLGALLAGAALVAVDLASPVLNATSAWHIDFAATAAVLVLTQRFAIGKAIRYALSRGLGRTRMMIVGAHDDAWRTLEHLHEHNRDNVHIVGHVAIDMSQDPTALGEVNDLSNLLETHQVTCVVIASHLERPILRQIIRQCLLHGVGVTVMPDLLGDATYKNSCQINWPQLQVAAPAQYVLQISLKRMLDIAGAAAGLLILSPVLGVIALAIKLDSRGPVLFRQWRPGLAGRLFGMLKFRTMHPDAEHILRADADLYRRFLETDCKLPVEIDPRITRVGALLRKTSLDEIPQLFNVLRGEMSLVGPRPVVGPELENYGEWTGSFLAVKPGMTGYWQVNGRSNVTYPERAHLDLMYITQWSLALDLKILLRTIPEVLRIRGAF